MRIVLDTNVIVSGLLFPKGKPGRLPILWASGHYEPILSYPFGSCASSFKKTPRGLSTGAPMQPCACMGWYQRPCLPKLKRVLDYPEIKKILPSKTKSQLIKAIRAHARWVQPARLPQAIQDKDDLVILGTAIAGRADLLVAGKQELLGLGVYKGVRLATPAQALEALGRR